MRSGSSALDGRAVVTVNAGVAGAFFLSSASLPQPARVRAKRISAAEPAREGKRMVVNGMGNGSVIWAAAVDGIEVLMQFIKRHEKLTLV